MNQEFIYAGAIFGALSIILGAFGAHALKKIFNEEQIKNFETGVKYQMYHALFLLAIGISPLEQYQTSCILYTTILGILFFSFSIYGLCLTSAFGNKWKWLGPITPIGGLLLLSSWIQLLII